MTRRGPALLATLAIVVVAAIGLALIATPTIAEAQTPTATQAAPFGAVPPTEAQALAVERQLLCPICTNERLDVCHTAICVDMKRIIRERLAAGSTPDDIILFFESRYGPKVRAELPREGFNLVLFGWVGGAIALTALAAGTMLYRLRRDSDRRAARASAPPSATDDQWVDRLVDEAADDDAGGTR